MHVRGLVEDLDRDALARGRGLEDARRRDDYARRGHVEKVPPPLRRVLVTSVVVSPSLRGPRLGAERWRLTALRSRTENREQRLFAVNARFFAVHRDEERCTHAERCEPREQTVRVVLSSDAVECADAQRCC